MRSNPAERYDFTNFYTNVIPYTCGSAYRAGLGPAPTAFFQVSRRDRLNRPERGEV